MLEKFYEIEVPKLNEKSEDFEDLMHRLKSPEFQMIVQKAQEKYLSWSDFKRKSWAGEDPRKNWLALNFTRYTRGQITPILDKKGHPFKYDPQLNVQFLHEIDLELGGTFMSVQHFTEADKKQFIRRNLIEESIASSQLEGANTSREAAKKLLNEGRSPKDKGEQMIVNNHRALQAIESDLRQEKMSMELLTALHQMVTTKTINEEYQGQLRETFNKNGKRLIIKPWDEETITYEAPDKEFVERELPKFIKFANDDPSFGFVHPLIKGIMLHFWIGLVHPFEDGNGRLARIVFYWYMLKKGYWGFSYLSLSERILKSPKQYAMAFVNSEQDMNDLNYFIHYNVSKLKLAKEEFRIFLERKILENKSIVQILKNGYDFNARQLKLLHYLAKDEQRFTTLKTHLEMNTDIKTVTASQDLNKLVKGEFLNRIRSGRNFYYYPTGKIKELFIK